MSLRSPLGRVRGLGSAKEGTSHWWQQRLTAIALVPLSVWFIQGERIMTATSTPAIDFSEILVATDFSDTSDNALAYARTCYSHLAGRLAVDIAEELQVRGLMLKRESRFG